MIARQTRAESGTEPAEKLRTEMVEARVKLGGDSEDDMVCAWRRRAVEDFAHFGCTVNARPEKVREGEFIRQKREGAGGAEKVCKKSGSGE